MKKEVLLDSIIGKTEEEGVKFLSENNIDFRIVRKDDTNYIVTYDFKPNRVNVELDNDVITYCYNAQNMKVQLNNKTFSGKLLSSDKLKIKLKEDSDRLFFLLGKIRQIILVKKIMFKMLYLQK